MREAKKKRAGLTERIRKTMREREREGEREGKVTANAESTESGKEREIQLLLHS